MTVKLAQGRVRASLPLLAAIAALLVPIGWMQLLLAAGGVLGLALAARATAKGGEPEPPLLKRRGVILLMLFALLLVGLPLSDSFCRVGALVLGGGHTVLPLLEAEVVTTGWVGSATFTAGYSAAQTVPGPLFLGLSRC